MQTVPFYIVLALLCGIFSLVSLTIMLPYPITKTRKFLIFLYTFAIISIHSFTALRLSLLPVVIPVLSGTLLIILLPESRRTIIFFSVILNLCVAACIGYLLMAIASHFFINDIFFSEYPYLFCLYFIVQIIFTYFASYYLYRFLRFFYHKVKTSALNEKHLAEQLAQTRIMKDYTDKIESLYLDIRTFKHDYINILSSLHGYIAEQDYKGLESYFHKEILPTGTKIALEDSIYGRLGNIQNTEIKSIVYAKVFSAFKEGIYVTTDVREKIVDYPMNTVDLVRILGILLDNALEASLTSEKKFLSISFSKDREGIYIQVTNSSPKINSIIMGNDIISDPDINSNHKNNIEKLYEKGATTKGGNRGIGLYEVRQILNQYPNAFLSTEYKECIFTQRLTLLYFFNPD